MASNKVFTRYLQKVRPTLFDSGTGARLPKEYRKFYDEWRNTPAKPVHYIPKEGNWERNEETGEVKRIENRPFPEMLTKELHQVFTGGEAIIQGFFKRKPRGIRIPHFWVPITFRSVVYSEILDKYMSVIMTKRAIDLIHEHKTLDHYLLETKACDIKTIIPIKLKRKLLFCLRDKDLPYDEKKNEEIYEKYKKYLLPPEEIEWYGLTFTEACKKLEQMEAAELEASKIPLKHVYRAQLIEELKANELSQKELGEKEQSKSWLSKMPGIKKLTGKES